MQVCRYSDMYVHISFGGQKNRTVAQASSSMHACKNYMYEIHTLTLTLKKSSMSWFLHTHHCTSSRSCADVDCPAAVMSYNASSSFLSSGHISTSTPEPGAPCRGDDSLATHKIGKFKSSLLVPAHKERAGFFLLLIPVETIGYNWGSKRALRVSREVTKK